MNLRYTGHKSEDRSLALSRLNILVGPWGSGKSSVGDALRIAALGCVPFLGSTHKATSALMRGDALEVVLDLGDGKVITRRLERHGKRFKLVSNASWLEEAGDEATHAEILRLFGGERIEVEEAFDIRALLGASANTRAARLETLMNADITTDPGDTAKAVALNTMLRLSEAKQVPKDPLTLLELIPDAQVFVLKASQTMLLAKITEGGIAGATAWANQSKRDHNKDAKGKSAAAKEVEERLDGRKVVEADLNLRAKEKEQAELQQKIGALRENQKTAEVYHVKVAEEEQRIFDLGEAVKVAAEGRTETLEWPIGEKRTRLKEIEKELDESEHPELGEDESARACEAAAARHRQSSVGLKDPEPIDMGTLPLTIATLEAEIRKAVASPWGDVRRHAGDINDGLITYAIGQGHKQGEVPDEWEPMFTSLEALRKLANDHTPDLEEMREKLGDVQIDLQAKKSDEHERDKIVEKNAKSRAESIDRAIELEEEAKAKRVALSDSLDARKAEWMDGTKSLREERLTIENEILGFEERRDRNKKTHDDAVRTLALANSRLNTLQEHPEETPEAVSEEEARLEELQVEITEMNKVVGAAQELEAIQEEIKVATAGATAFKAIEWALQRQREIELQAAGASLTDIVAKFLTAAGRTEKAYFRAGDGSIDIGWDSDLGPVPVQAMSGGEWALFTAALVSSVLILREGKVRILIVEAAEIGEHLPVLCAGIESVASELSCVLVMTQARARPENPAAWNVIEMEASTVEASP